MFFSVLDRLAFAGQESSRISAMLTRSFDCDLDGVVVAVAVGVDALPEDGEVFFGTQPVRMESMASTERFSTGQIKQRRHLVFKSSLECLFITQNFNS